MTRVSESSDPDLVCANQALNNIIYPLTSLEPYHYQNEIDWAVGGKSGTWYLYFQSLRVVGYLANAAEISGDAHYLEKAAEIIESWYDFHHDNDEPPFLAWYDHTVADQSWHVMHFLRAYQSLQDVHLPDSLFGKVYIMLEQHGNWLLDEENYHANNHRLMASIALTQLGLTLPDLDDSGLWKETGVIRIKERIEDDLSMENVHLEHSAFYHRLFLELVLQIEEYLGTKGLALFEPGNRTVEELKQYVAYMVKPNRRLPMIGDTSDDVMKNDYDYPWIMYSLSDGEEGIKPPSNSMVYPGAGVAIFRDEWKSGENFTRTTYVMLQAGFHSTTHKHADDLGFILYSHGEDIFVGPGVYAYDRCKYRQYVRSAQAHNTLTVDGKSYALSSGNAGKADITAYRLEAAFDFVQGSHVMYKGITLKRGIIFVRPGTILVIDEALSESEHSIQQIWNLSPAAHDLGFDDSGASFSVGENGVSVEIRQFHPATGVNHYYGQEEPVRGFISPHQRELVPVHQLEFESYGSGVVFVTQISVTGPDEDVPAIEVDLDDPYRNIVVRYSDGTTLTINLDSVLQN
jgi:hypothetical protein